MHPIKRYCTEHEISQRAFAGICGLTPAYISQMVNGHVTPGRIAGETIVRVTGGEIRLSELFSWEPRDVA